MPVWPHPYGEGDNVYPLDFRDVLGNYLTASVSGINGVLCTQPDTGFAVASTLISWQSFGH